MAKNITKIKLSDGSVYSIFDTGALRLDAKGRLITGNRVVDKVLLQGKLYITEINDVPVEQSIANVLVQDTVTGEIKKRSANQLLADIGGISYQMNESTGTLSLKIGKQES